jgi:hypothetical protein
VSATRAWGPANTPMEDRMFTRTSPLLITVLAFLAGGQPLLAQQTRSPRAPSRVPVTIALVGSLVRADVILLRSDAGSDQLSEAVRTLLVIRQASGDTATSKATLRMRPNQAQRGAQRQARREFPWVHRVIADLRRAEPREIVGVGTVRAVEIWLPPQQRRGSRR